MRILYCGFTHSRRTSPSALRFRRRRCRRRQIAGVDFVGKPNNLVGAVTEGLVGGVAATAKRDFRPAGEPEGCANAASPWIEGNVKGNFACQRTGKTDGFGWDRLGQFLRIDRAKRRFADIPVHTGREGFTRLPIAMQNAVDERFDERAGPTAIAAYPTSRPDLPWLSGCLWGESCQPERTPSTQSRASVATSLTTFAPRSLHTTLMMMIATMIWKTRPLHTRIAKPRASSGLTAPGSQALPELNTATSDITSCVRLSRPGVRADLERNTNTMRLPTMIETKTTNPAANQRRPVKRSQK